MSEATDWIEAVSSHPADVCIIVEGAYPFVPGGVSSWIDWLIKTQSDKTFCVVALLPRPTNAKPRYIRPPNVTGFQVVYLQERQDAGELLASGNVVIEHRPHVLVVPGEDAAILTAPDLGQHAAEA